MLYLNPKPFDDGAYSPPQSLKVNGLLEFPDELVKKFVSYNGFVSLTIEGNTVTAIEPNVEAWEAWKATRTEETELAQNEDNTPVTWAELDAAYNEGRDGAYEQ